MTQLVQRECSAVPSKKPPGSTKFPPSLARAESELKKLCNELGGPADIGIPVDKNDLEVYCREYPAGLLLPILLRFQTNEAVARRHWPWAAFAISQYASERSERAEYTDEPSPTEILKILGKIRQSAGERCSFRTIGNCDLSKWARWSDHSSTLMAWRRLLDRYLERFGQ